VILSIFAFRDLASSSVQDLADQEGFTDSRPPATPNNMIKYFFRVQTNLFFQDNEKMHVYGRSRITGIISEVYRGIIRKIVINIIRVSSGSYQWLGIPSLKLAIIARRER
jgi:hypothetical protein